MSNIPRAMVRLRRLADDIETSGLYGYAKRLRTIVTQDLPRRKPVTKVYGTRRLCTPALRRRIKLFAADNPGWTQQRIAERFNVTNARVSETLNP